MPDQSRSASQPLRVAVIGGGTAGLAAALRLKERIPASALELDIFEASDVLGGNNQSFDGVPLFFSCFRSSGAPEMIQYMKKLGLKATSCQFTSLSLKDRSGGKHSTKEFTSPPTNATTLNEGVKSLNEGGTKKLSVSDSSSIKDDSDSSSEISSNASTAASKTALKVTTSEQSPQTAISEYTGSTFENAVAKAFCLGQEYLSTPSLSKYMTKLLWCDLTSKPQSYKMHSLAAGINYFYSSRDQGFKDKHVEEYYHLNCGTYYWSIENGRNDLLIERMRDRLMNGKAEGNVKRQKPGCLACVRADMSDIDTQETDDEDMKTQVNEDSTGQSQRRSRDGKVVIRCGTCVTSVEQLVDGTVRVHYEPSSSSPESASEKSNQGRCSGDEGAENQKAAVFDHVIVCVHPHVAQKLLKDYQPLRSLFDEYPFRPIRAHAIVHTDQSVKCSSSTGPTALTYEIGEDGSWILHIDCEQYYGMEKGKGNGNMVSIFYAPDSCDSIDPKLVKERFSAVLSKSAAHDQGTEQAVEKALRGRLRKYHQEAGSNVYLCGSYYCYEQWSQDAFAMAVEVADCVVEKFNQAELRGGLVALIDLAGKNESLDALDSVAGTACGSAGAAQNATVTAHWVEL